MPDTVAPFRVPLSPDRTPFPEPRRGDARGFSLRGTKGWNWTAEQYLQEIPTLVMGRMNFLMNCYLSLYSDPQHYRNEWWLPLPEATRQAYARVMQTARAWGIHYCFAMHPQLHSPRPLDPTNAQDFEQFAAHFDWAQSQSARWFCVALDDVGGVRIDAAEHAAFVNKLLVRLRRRNPQVQMIFCPTHYWGDGTAEHDRPYLQTLARELDPEAYVFWTGREVYALKIARRDAESFRAAVQHRLILWDNYPVNDGQPTLHLGPVSGRDGDLPPVIEGYMSNPLCPQNQINRLPLLTCADYAWNPSAYEPLRAIGQAIACLGETPAQQQVLRELVEAYPGSIAAAQPRSDFSGVRERLKQMGVTSDDGRAYVAHLDDLFLRLRREFPDCYADAAQTLAQDLAWARSSAITCPA